MTVGPSNRQKAGSTARAFLAPSGLVESVCCQTHSLLTDPAGFSVKVKSTAYCIAESSDIPKVHKDRLIGFAKAEQATLYDKL